MRAKLEHAKQLAHLHRDNIKLGFLSSLGIKFLVVLYTFLIKYEIVFIYKNEGKVVGFVSASLNPKGMIKRFIKIYFFRIILALLNNLLCFSFYKKIFETLRSTFKSRKESTLNINNILPELLSIVVLKEYRGTEVSRLLIKDLETLLHNKKIKEYIVIVGDKLIEAKKFYFKNGFKLENYTTIHNYDKSCILIKELI